MLETIVFYLNNTYIPAWGIILAAFLFAYIENVFPPSPSDTVIIFLGSLAALGKVGYIELIVSSTIGSVLGFLTMYYLGVFLGHRILHSKKFPFITEEKLQKPRDWFNKYGYVVIVINRFLSGTRAVISFVAGMTELKAFLTIVLTSVSAILWNTLLVVLGMTFGRNWKLVDKSMEIYGNIMFGAVILLFLSWIAYIIFKKVKAKEQEYFHRNKLP